MTAEVAILNKLAVALAADSALTTGVGEREKIFSGANKIFALSEFAPVGIMIYGHVEYCSVPWEMLIKEFRRRLGDERLDNLLDYVERFKAFLCDPKIISETQRNAYVFFLAAQTYFALTHYISANDLKENERGFDAALDAMESAAVEAESIPEFSEYSFSKFKKSYAEVLTAFVEDDQFMKCKLPRRRRKRFYELVYANILSNQEAPLMTGIVIAGFGEEEFFPTIKEIKVDGVLDGRPRIVNGRFCDISRGKDTVFISAFAQDDAANAFIDGVDKEYKDHWSGMSTSFLLNFSEELLKEHTQYDEEGRAVVLALVKDKISDTIDQFKDVLDKFSKRNYRTPVEEVLRTAPKDELAHVAEALVNLTALQRRVSGERETVGGPIDVAVISKGDGLVWIKRKHYFPAELNPQFIRNRFGGGHGPAPSDTTSRRSHA